MGAKNVIAALAMYPRLDHAPMRLLVGMAVHSLDDATERYPAGRAFLGEAALIEIVNCGKSSLYEHLKKLHAAGAVTTVERGRPGHRAVYQLHLDPMQARPAQPEAYASGSAGGSTSGSAGGTGSGSPGGQGAIEDPLEEITVEENPAPSVPQGLAFGNADDEGFTYEQASKAVQAKHGAARAYEVAEAYRQAQGLDDIKAATIALAERERQAAA